MCPSALLTFSYPSLTSSFSHSLCLFLKNPFLVCSRAHLSLAFCKKSSQRRNSAARVLFKTEIELFHPCPPFFCCPDAFWVDLLTGSSILQIPEVVLLQFSSLQGCQKKGVMFCFTFLHFGPRHKDTTTVENRALIETLLQKTQKSSFATRAWLHCNCCSSFIVLITK